MLLTYKFDLKNFPVFTAKLFNVAFPAEGKTTQINKLLPFNVKQCTV
jgi:hypothetical protein